MDKNLNLARI